MQKALILWAVWAAIGHAQAAQPSPLSQKSSGFTQNNVSGLSQNRDGRIGTATATNTDTNSALPAIQQPVDPTLRLIPGGSSSAPGKPGRMGQTPLPALVAPAPGISLGAGVSAPIPSAERRTNLPAALQSNLPAEAAPASGGPVTKTPGNE